MKYVWYSVVRRFQDEECSFFVPEGCPCGCAAVILLVLAKVQFTEGISKLYWLLSRSGGQDADGSAMSSTMI